eukprot:1157263-Pelagomonas_calceolata.AAC.11
MSAPGLRLPPHSLDQHVMPLDTSDLKAARVGDTWLVAGTRAEVEPLPGFRSAKSMVYASLYPVDSEDFDALAVVRVCVCAPAIARCVSTVKLRRPLADEASLVPQPQGSMSAPSRIACHHASHALYHAAQAIGQLFLKNASCKANFACLSKP